MSLMKKEESTDESREDQDCSIPCCGWRKILQGRGCCWQREKTLSYLCWDTADLRSPNGMLVSVKFLDSTLNKTFWCRGQKTFSLLVCFSPPSPSVFMQVASGSRCWFTSVWSEVRRSPPTPALSTKVCPGSREGFRLSGQQVWFEQLFSTFSGLCTIYCMSFQPDHVDGLTHKNKHKDIYCLKTMQFSPCLTRKILLTLLESLLSCAGLPELGLCLYFLLIL